MQNDMFKIKSAVATMEPPLESPQNKNNTLNTHFITTDSDSDK